MACTLLWSSAVRVHDSQAYRKMDVTVSISLSHEKVKSRTAFNAFGTTKRHGSWVPVIKLYLAVLLAPRILSENDWSLTARLKIACLQTAGTFIALLTPSEDLKLAELKVIKPVIVSAKPK